MKIKALRNCGYNFTGYGKSEFFKQNEIYDLDERKAKKLIELGYAKSLIEAEKPKLQEKMQDVSKQENKMLDISSKETKKSKKSKEKQKVKKSKK
jgi:hypothetical protein